MIYVRMTDSFMSGWGLARDKTNVLVIACDDWQQADAVEAAANKRSEMKRVKIVSNKPRNRPGILYSNKTFSDLGGPWLEFYKPRQP